MKKTNERVFVGDELYLDYEIDRDEGEFLDTRVSIVGEFWVSGEKRQEFADRLEKLITEYRI